MVLQHEACPFNTDNGLTSQCCTLRLLPCGWYLAGVAEHLLALRLLMPTVWCGSLLHLLHAGLWNMQLLLPRCCCRCCSQCCSSAGPPIIVICAQ